MAAVDVENNVFIEPPFPPTEVSRSRANPIFNWQFTINNYTNDDLEEVEIVSAQCNYLVYGKEVGENGTPHLQGMLQLKKKKRFSQMKKLLRRAHFEQCRNPAMLARYCKKDGDFVEYGRLVSQGYPHWFE